VVVDLNQADAGAVVRSEEDSITITPDLNKNPVATV
jgi:hypothetical protein